MSFHLGADTSTIDLQREVTPEEIALAEVDANDVVFADRTVTIRFASEEEAARLPLRKEPARTGRLRLVEIEQCDLSACGGTHVPSAGRVGLIAVTGWERFKGATRLAFVCGERARRSHGRLRDVVTGAMRALSVTASRGGRRPSSGCSPRTRRRAARCGGSRRKWRSAARRDCAPRPQPSGGIGSS